MEKPEYFTATRKGWGESEYDAFGEQAPLSWVCDYCGSWITLESFDHETEEYVDTPRHALEHFIAQHAECPNKLGAWLELLEEVKEAFYNNQYDQQAVASALADVNTLMSMNYLDEEEMSRSFLEDCNWLRQHITEVWNDIHNESNETIPF